MRNKIIIALMLLICAVLGLVLAHAQTPTQQQIVALAQQVNSDIQRQIEDNANMGAQSRAMSRFNQQLMEAKALYDGNEADYQAQQSYIDNAEAFFHSLNPVNEDVQGTVNGEIQ